MRFFTTEKGVCHLRGSFGTKFCLKDDGFFHSCEVHEGPFFTSACSCGTYNLNKVKGAFFKPQERVVMFLSRSILEDIHA